MPKSIFVDINGYAAIRPKYQTPKRLSTLKFSTLLPFSFYFIQRALIITNDWRFFSIFYSLPSLLEISQNTSPCHRFWLGSSMIELILVACLQIFELLLSYMRTAKNWGDPFKKIRGERFIKISIFSLICDNHKGCHAKIIFKIWSKILK